MKMSEEVVAAVTAKKGVCDKDPSCTVKKSLQFSRPTQAGMSLTKLSLAGNN
jgi:hypothetical protein